MKEKLNINKLIANHIIETGINDTCSFNYIVYLDSYLEEYDTDTQKYKGVSAYGRKIESAT